MRRAFAEVAPGRRLSALVWREGDPELVLLPGGAQNAHTWDTVAMVLDRPLVAIDLPGHGHSDGPGDRPDGTGDPLDADGNAADVVHVTEAGHSLQGDTPLELAAIIERFVYG